MLGRQPSSTPKVETDGKGLEVAIVHVGGNLFVRETYNPQVKYGIIACVRVMERTPLKNVGQQ